jgi:hypothetical protein
MERFLISGLWDFVNAYEWKGLYRRLGSVIFQSLSFDAWTGCIIPLR